MFVVLCLRHGAATGCHNHNNVAGDTQQLRFLYLRPPIQPTIMRVDLCHKNVGPPQFAKHVPFNTNHLYQFITPHSTLNATQLTKAPTKQVTITPLSLPIYSTLKFTYVTKYDRRPHSDTQTERNERTVTKCNQFQHTKCNSTSQPRCPRHNKDLFYTSVYNLCSIPRMNS
jgi:hypothetical protein